MTSQPHNPQTTPVRRKAAVAVIVRDERLLVIRRSEKVVAPGKLCFPGGGILPEEAEQDAVIREIEEEIGVVCVPLRKIWQSQTSWGADIAWWETTIDADASLTIDVAEVAEAFWLRPTELHARADLLPSNYQFLSAWKSAKFTIPGFSDPFGSHAGD